MQQKKSSITTLRLFGLLVVTALFVGLIAYVLVWQDEIKTAQIEVPLIAAPASAVKKRPDQPGGMDFPHRDKVVFDLLADKPVNKNIIEKKVVQKQAVAVPQKLVEVKPQQDALEALIQKVEPAVVTQAPQQTVQTIAPSGWGVQLASFTTQSDAQKAIKTYQSKFKSLQAMTSYIQKADLGAKGMRYRVRFFGSPTKSAAVTLCKQLKTKGQGCFQVKS